MDKTRGGDRNRCKKQSHKKQTGVCPSSHPFCLIGDHFPDDGAPELF